MTIRHPDFGQHLFAAQNICQGLSNSVALLSSGLCWPAKRAAQENTVLEESDAIELQKYLEVVGGTTKTAQGQERE